MTRKCLVVSHLPGTATIVLTMRCKSIGVKTFIFRAPRIASFAGLRKGKDTMCSEYNGWTNYETWNMNLWLTNDSSFYEIAEDAIQVIVSDDYTDTEDKPIAIEKDDLVCKTAEWLKEHAYDVYLDGFDSTDYRCEI